ncbi:MAG TPA: patatin-like phospholipase family protein [Clostridiaceae bacterium]|nr:patatin-like phospholipase family protein [Clostridiaceae bacterium]
MRGLVLEGGGAKGAYHIGVVKSLYEMGFDFQAVAGTSVGALNGAMIVQGEIDKAYDIWYNLCPEKVIRLTDTERRELKYIGEQEKRLGAKLERLRKIIADRGLDISPLESLLRAVIDEEKIRNSKMEFGIVTYDLTSRRPVEVYKEDIPHGKLIDYLIASSSLPVFKLKTIDDKVYLDGGIYNVLPVNLVQQKGCKDVVVIRTYTPFGRIRKFNEKGLNIINIGPTESLGPVLDFSTTRARRNLLLGYFDAKRVVLKLKGKRYYIKPFKKDENFFVDYFVELDDAHIKSVCELFGIENTYGRRALFEHIIPKIGNILNIPSNASYGDIVVSLIEHAAQVLEIEQFSIYTIKELLTNIMKKYRGTSEDIIKQIPAFIRNMNVISKIVKDKIIVKIAVELLGNMLEKDL